MKLVQTTAFRTTLMVFFNTLICFQVHVLCAYQALKIPTSVTDCYNRTIVGYKSDAFKKFMCINNFLLTQNSTIYIPVVTVDTFEYISYLFGKYTEDEGYGNDYEDYDDDERDHRYKSRAGQRRCIRKEVRQLSDKELKAVVDCYWYLKRDKRLKPSVYEAIANIHSSVTTDTTHSGQAFLSWHMLYTLIMEFTMREECNPDICIPYWDPRPDQRLPDPRTSAFFELYGGFSGPLSKPFSGWHFWGNITAVRNANLGRLTRDLFNYNDTKRIYANVQTTDDLSVLQAHRDPDDQKSIIEVPHNTLHNFLGGTVKATPTAAQDPLFFSLHSFIELVFSTALRIIQPPSARRVYPGGHYYSGHRPDDYMMNLGWRKVGGVRRLFRNRDAYETNWRKYYRYAPELSCQDGCQPNKYFYCCRGECIAYRSGSRKKETFCQEDSEKERNSTTNDLYHNESNDTLIEYPVLNDYFLDGFSDLSLWAYVAVSISYKNRVINFGDACFKYNEQSLVENVDLYDSINHRHTTVSKDCNPSSAGRGLVYITTYGANYRGTFDAHSVFDYQDKECVSSAYVGIKRPTKTSFTDVIISAHDHCGRVCKPHCPVIGSRPIKYEPCDGMIRIDLESENMFGLTLEEVTKMYWDFVNGTEIHRKFPYTVNFICDGVSHLSDN